SACARGRGPARAVAARPLVGGNLQREGRRRAERADPPARRWPRYQQQSRGSPPDRARSVGIVRRIPAACIALAARPARPGARADPHAARAPRADPAAPFSPARSDLFESVLALEQALATSRRNRGAKTFGLATSALERFRAQVAPLLAAAPGNLSSAPGAMQALLALPRVVAGVGDLGARVCDQRERLLEADAQVRSCRLARQLALLAEEAERRYRAEKARVRGLDFDDLTRLARDLLATEPSVRALEKGRRGLLLVDEFQDTSRAQLELLGWLAEGSQEGTAPPGSGLPGAAPISLSTLVVVGDRKQSIYEFRGADVAGAGTFAQRAIAEGAQACVLRTSRRSRPALVRFSNALFRVALAPGERSFDTPFGDDDALEAFRPEGPSGACAELLDVSR